MPDPPRRDVPPGRDGDGLFDEIDLPTVGRRGGAAARTKPRAVLRLARAEREAISRGVRAAESCRVIARRMGRAPSTVAREIPGHGGRGRYRAWHADARAVHDAQRPKVPKLVPGAPLRHEVERGLARRWSPQPRRSPGLAR